MKDFKDLTIVEGDGAYELPKDCELADIASQKLEKDNTEARYRFINILTLSLLFIFSAVLFLTVSGSNIVDNNNVLTWKSFVSGDYTRSLKTSYEKDLPFPEEMKKLEERLSLIYGIGNKISDPVKEVDEETDTARNSFDEPGEEPDDSTNNNEKVVTSAVTDEMGITVTTAAEKGNEKQTTTTTAIDRPDDEDETTTTTTETATTTNTDPPEFTVTETYPVTQPGPTQTKTETHTDPPDTETDPPEPEPPDTESSQPDTPVEGEES